MLLVLLSIGTGLLTLSHSPLKALMSQFCSSAFPCQHFRLPVSGVFGAAVMGVGGAASLSYTILFALWK